MCDSVHRGGVSASVHAGIPHPPRSRYHTPPGSRPPQEQTPPLGADIPPWEQTPLEQTPPWSRLHWEQTPPGSRHPLGLSTHTPRRHPPVEQTPPPGKQTPVYGQRAAVTHPTAMHSCFLKIFEGCKSFLYSHFGWTSGDICSGLQSQGGSLACMLC